MNYLSYGAPQFNPSFFCGSCSSICRFLCVVVCRSFFVFLSFIYDYMVCLSSVCGLLWYLQTFSYYSWHDLTIGKTFDIFTYKWHLLYGMNFGIIPVHRSRFFHMFPFTIIIKLINIVYKKVAIHI